MVFHVSPAVLIPRPETEAMVEQAIRWGRTREGLHAVDIGTGSGCIAITLATQLPRSVIVAADISAAALAIARENADRLAPGKVTFVQADLLEPFSAGFDIILANLPYIAGHEWLGLADGVKFHEPALALYGGSDGFDLIRRLLPQAAERLRPGGIAFLEIGWQQGEQARDLARAAFPRAEIDMMKDFANHDRVVIVRT
jgi:release factor glutamine methyltransferase